MRTKCEVVTAKGNLFFSIGLILDRMPPKDFLLSQTYYEMEHGKAMRHEEKKTS